MQFGIAPTYPAVLGTVGEHTKVELGLSEAKPWAQLTTHSLPSDPVESQPLTDDGSTSGGQSATERQGTQGQPDLIRTMALTTLTRRSRSIPISIRPARGLE